MNFGNGWLKVVNTFRKFIFENWGVTVWYQSVGGIFGDN